MCRYDIGNLTRGFVLRALTLQNGTVSIAVYLVGLLLSLAAVEVEDRIHLQHEQPMLWNSTDVSPPIFSSFWLIRHFHLSLNCWYESIFSFGYPVTQPLVTRIEFRKALRTLQETNDVEE